MRKTRFVPVRANSRVEALRPPRRRTSFGSPCTKSARKWPRNRALARVLPRVGLRAVENKSPGRLCPSIAFAPSSVPTRARTRFAGHFRTILPHALIEPAADTLKAETKERARTNKERGQNDQARPTQTQKDCNTPSSSAAAWDDQAPSHPNAEGPGSYSLPPLSASFAASPSTSPKPSLKLLGTTTVPPVSRTLSYSRCMARRRSATSFSA